MRFSTDFAMRVGKLNDARFGKRMGGEGIIAEQISRMFQVAHRKVGIQFLEIDERNRWIPAFAGMTDFFAIEP